VSEIEHFTFEITPWVIPGFSRDGMGTRREWRIRVRANGVEHGYTQIMPRIPFSEAELEAYVRAALAAFRDAGGARP